MRARILQNPFLIISNIQFAYNFSHGVGGVCFCGMNLDGSDNITWTGFVKGGGTGLGSEMDCNT
jgi:hypothetical protein